MCWVIRAGSFTSRPHDLEQGLGPPVELPMAITAGRDLPTARRVNSALGLSGRGAARRRTRRHPSGAAGPGPRRGLWLLLRRPDRGVAPAALILPSTRTFS